MAKTNIQSFTVDRSARRDGHLWCKGRGLCPSIKAGANRRARRLRRVAVRRGDFDFSSEVRLTGYDVI